MNDDSGLNFQELNALLNWAPEEELTTIGEVRSFLAAAVNLLHLMGDKHAAAMSALTDIGMVLAVDHGPQSPAVLNVLSLLTLTDHMGSAMEHCLSRDILLMDTFLDAFAGEDRSGQ